MSLSLCCQNTTQWQVTETNKWIQADLTTTQYLWSYEWFCSYWDHFWYSVDDFCETEVITLKRRGTLVAQVLLAPSFIFHQTLFCSNFCPAINGPSPSLQVCRETSKMLKTSKVDVFAFLSNSNSIFFFFPPNLFNLNGQSPAVCRRGFLITLASDISQLWVFLPFQIHKPSDSKTTIWWHV